MNWEEEKVLELIKELGEEEKIFKNLKNYKFNILIIIFLYYKVKIFLLFIFYMKYKKYGYFFGDKSIILKAIIKESFFFIT